jgi:hypothetical protein
MQDTWGGKKEQWILNHLGLWYECILALCSISLQYPYVPLQLKQRKLKVVEHSADAYLPHKFNACYMCVSV